MSNIVRRVPYNTKDNEKIKEYVQKHFGNPNKLTYWQRAKDGGDFKDHSAESLKAHWNVMNKKSKSKKFNSCKVVSKYIKTEISALSSPIEHSLSNSSQNIDLLTPKNEENLDLTAISHSILEISQSLEEDKNFTTISHQRLESDTNFNQRPETEANFVQPLESQIFLSQNSQSSIIVKKRKAVQTENSKKKEKLSDVFFNNEQTETFFGILLEICSRMALKRIPPEQLLAILIQFNGSVSQTINYFSNK